MKAARARIVLVVSALNEISREFHNFPAKPVGIIVVKNRIQKYKFFDVLSGCEGYCRRHKLEFKSIATAEISDIGEILKTWNADLVITHSVPVIPMSALESVSFGGMNLHHSLLPAYRGGNPLLWQVIDRCAEIGVSVHRLSAEVDSGDVFGQTSFARPAGVLKRALAQQANSEHGLALLKKVIGEYLEGRLEPKPQPLESSTPSANHFPLQRLLPILAQRQVTLDGLWDIAQLFGAWPEQSTPSTGWQAWFQWRPKRLQVACQSNHDDSKSATYCFDRVGHQLHLRHAEGCIVFSPKLHMPTILAKLVLR